MRTPEYDREKCEWCGAESMLMSCLIGGEWTQLCSTCYQAFALEPQEIDDERLIPGYDEFDEDAKHSDDNLSASELQDLKMWKENQRV
jgi:hypothetical protein